MNYLLKFVYQKSLAKSYYEGYKKYIIAKTINLDIAIIIIITNILCISYLFKNCLLKVFNYELLIMTYQI